VPVHVSEQRQLSRFCSATIDCDADAAFIRLGGEFDLSCEDGMRAEIARITDWRASAVVVDLGDVTFIDSAGLRMLIELDSTSRQDDFKVTIVGAGGQVRHSLRITGLDLLLPLVEPARGLDAGSRR
jgi:anti-anti-sigma factor